MHKIKSIRNNHHKKLSNFCTYINNDDESKVVTTLSIAKDRRMRSEEGSQISYSALRV